MALNVPNAPQTALAREGPGRLPADQAPARSKRRWFSRRQAGELRIYQHSNLLYWWPIWAWGFICAGLTYVQGVGVDRLAARAARSAWRQSGCRRRRRRCCPIGCGRP